MNGSSVFVELKEPIQSYCEGGGVPFIGGRVIFKPVVLDLGLRESVGFPFLPPPSFGLRVGLRPEGGRVNPGEGGLGDIGGGVGETIVFSSGEGGISSGFSSSS